MELVLSSVAIVIIWCYHVMLSSGMITPPFFVFPENFTHSRSWRLNLLTVTVLPDPAGFRALNKSSTERRPRFLLSLKMAPPNPISAANILALATLPPS